MIEKSRLEKLIKQDKKIYFIDWAYKEIKSVNKIVVSDYIITLEIVNDLLYVIRKEDAYKPEIIWKLKLNDLFETRKQAEWALKYQHIPRAEYLDLPIWEEFCKHKYISFNDEFCSRYVLKLNKNSKLILTKYPEDWEIFYEQATEENYEKACDLCVKLFKEEYI